MSQQVYPHGEGAATQDNPLYSNSSSSSGAVSRRQDPGIAPPPFTSDLYLPEEDDAHLREHNVSFEDLKAMLNKKLISIDLVDTWLEASGISLASRMAIVQRLVVEKSEPTWIHLIPFVNLFYELFFDEDCNQDSIKLILELFGIMSGLLFSVVVAVGTTRNYEELADGIERWDSYNCPNDGADEVYYFIKMTAVSMTMSFSAFLIILLTYATVVSSEFDGPGNLKSWWMISRWAVFLCFVLLAISVIALFNSLCNYIQWNTPNVSLHSVPCSGDYMSNKVSNIWVSLCTTPATTATATLGQ